MGFVKCGDDGNDEVVLSGYWVDVAGWVAFELIEFVDCVLGLG
jgi:hypothetical protein